MLWGSATDGEAPGHRGEAGPATRAWLAQGTGGADRDRTDDPLLAKQVLSQLSYSPGGLVWWVWMDSNHRPPPYQDGALTN
jgi:hypothetical protein